MKTLIGLSLALVLSSAFALFGDVIYLKIEAFSWSRKLGKREMM